MSVSQLTFSYSSAGNAAQYILVENTSKKQRIHLDSIAILIATDGTVANRYAYLRIYDDKGRMVAAIQGSAVPASSSIWNVFSKSVGTTTSGSSVHCFPVPKLWLEPFQKLKFDLSAGVAGDTCTIYISTSTERVAFTN